MSAGPEFAYIDAVENLTDGGWELIATRLHYERTMHRWPRHGTLTASTSHSRPGEIEAVAVRLAADPEAP